MTFSGADLARIRALFAADDVGDAKGVLRLLRQGGSAEASSESPAPVPAPRVIVETPGAIEAALERAKRARLRRERHSGRRTYTIESGWVQRPGAQTS